MQPFHRRVSIDDTVAEREADHVDLVDQEPRPTPRQPQLGQNVFAVGHLISMRATDECLPLFLLLFLVHAAAGSLAAFSQCFAVYCTSSSSVIFFSTQSQ